MNFFRELNLELQAFVVFLAYVLLLPILYTFHVHMYFLTGFLLYLFYFSVTNRPRKMRILMNILFYHPFWWAITKWYKSLPVLGIIWWMKNVNF
jgi:hypothetical protein